MLGDPGDQGRTSGSKVMSSAAKRDVRAGEVQQAGIACAILVVTAEMVVRRGELLRLNRRPSGAAQDRDLPASELCQFAHHAASRFRKAPLGTGNRAQTARARGTERGGRIARRSAPRPRPQNTGSEPNYPSRFL